VWRHVAERTGNVSLNHVMPFSLSPSLLQLGQYSSNALRLTFVSFAIF
jgi:hypothetical protein